MGGNWLTSMQNGSIGEARTKAFLIDRFYILERSVDLEGADFIIQRRLVADSLLDERAPRLGFVQAKFFQDGATTHYIRKDYILDRANNPREEFFLIAHSGDEEMPRVFFLSAKMIADNFRQKEKNGSTVFVISASTLLSSSKYLVEHKKKVLNRIENQLELADLTSNRRFLQNFESSILDPAAILADYKETLANWWGDIPVEFKKLKQSMHSAMEKLQSVHEQLREIANEVDPLKALSLLETFSHYECNAGRDWSVKLPQLYDPEFVYVCKEHQRKIENLTRKGLLDVFLDLPKQLKSRISPYLTENSPVSPNMIHQVSLKYSTKNLSIISLEQEIIPVSTYFDMEEKFDQFGHVPLRTDKYEGFKESPAGVICYYWLAGRYSTGGKAQPEHFLHANDLKVYVQCAEKMYQHLD